MQRRWFPAGLFFLWLAGTGVHLYCLGYVYDFDLRRELLTPVLWVLAWTLHRRLTDFIAIPAPALKTVTLVLPLLATWSAVGAESGSVFFVLNLLNVLGFAGSVLAERDNRVALHLSLISLAAAVAGAPHGWTQPVLGEFGFDKLAGVAGLVYLLLFTALSRNPKFALLGAVTAAIAGAAVRGEHADTAHWAAQAGLVFLLLHSLRWRDIEHDGAGAVRAIAAVVWVLHAFVWTRDGAAFWQPLAVAGVVLVVCVGLRLIRGRWIARVVPVAGMLVAVAGPANFIIIKLQTTPVGVMAVAGSFLLFGLGTIAALTKHRWNKKGQPGRIT